MLVTLAQDIDGYHAMMSYLHTAMAKGFFGPNGSSLP